MLEDTNELEKRHMSSYMAKRDNLVPFIVFDVRIGHQKRTETFLAKDGKFQINSKENKKTENRNKTNLFGQKQEVANNQRATDKTRRAPIPTVNEFVFATFKIEQGGGACATTFFWPIHKLSCGIRPTQIFDLSHFTRWKNSKLLCLSIKF